MAEEIRSFDWQKAEALRQIYDEDLTQYKDNPYYIGFVNGVLYVLGKLEAWSEVDE